MGHARHNFTGPPRTRGRARIEVVQQTTTTPQAHPQEPSGTLGMGVTTRVTMRVVLTNPLTVTLSPASEPEPPLLIGTLTGAPFWSDTSVMGFTRLSARWKGSKDLSIGWMTLHACKRRCKPPSTHRPA
jgi:hypothetical protein